MSEEDFGGGIQLDEDWDFEIDSTGDIKTAKGVAELEKDLAFRSTVAIQPYLGQPIDNTLAEKVRNILREAMLQDDRIEAVESISFERTGRDEITVTVTVITSDASEYELIFPVGE
jgi:hypothetical protein